MHSGQGFPGRLTPLLARGRIGTSQLLMGWRTLRAGGSLIVLASAAIVASMVASILLGPAGDQVLARDGYSNRDFYASNLVGVVLGTGPRFAARAVEPRPIRATASRTWRAGRSLARSEREAATPLAALRSPQQTSSSVCVRLCDGYYFPIGTVRRSGDIATHTAVCSSACPGAPTRLYLLPSEGSEIDHAVAVTNGRSYAALPVAYAHTTGIGPTCACHAEASADAALRSPLEDITMRRGDSIMTPVGWRVFRGADHWPYRRADFSTVGAAALPSRTRSTLIAMENASLHRPTRAPLRSADLKIQVSLSPDAGTLARPANTTVADQR